MYKKCAFIFSILNVIFTISSSFALADSAETIFLPPVPGSLQKHIGADATIGKIPVSELVAQPYPTYNYTGMVGRKSMLRKEAEGKQPLRIAVGENINIEGRLIFADPVQYPDGNYYAVGEFMVDEAEGIRLTVDVSRLSSSDKLWVVVPELFVVYGPYPQGQDSLEETWLPSVQGNSVILILQTNQKFLPDMKVVSFQFYYLPLEDLAKSLPCPLSSPCVEDTEYQQITSSVGMLTIPCTYGTIMCTGTILNVPDTSELEPYLISAHHCFAETGIKWSAIEVIWDYRVANCEDTAEPNLNTCPRTTGATNLTESTCLDGQFIKLTGTIPVGDYGRAYAGWSSEELNTGMTIYGAHHPDGKYLRSAIGTIKGTDITSCMDSLCAESRYHTTKILWDEGITSQGSSGSGAFCKDYGYQLVGMLSNGPTHSCIDRSGNFDYFASFRYFYPLIRCYMKPGTECENKADCDKLCFFKYMMAPSSEGLQLFRQMRSWLKNQGEWGNNLVKFYYQQSSTWIYKVEENPELNKVVESVLKDNFSKK